MAGIRLNRRSEPRRDDAASQRCRGFDDVDEVESLGPEFGEGRFCSDSSEQRSKVVRLMRAP